MKKDDFWRKAAGIEMGILGALIFIGILGIIKGSFFVRWRYRGDYCVADSGFRGNPEKTSAMI